MFPKTLRAFLVLALLASLGSTSWAKKHKGAAADNEKKETIVEISPASLTVDVGQGVQESYQITGTTKSTLDGNPVNVDDLKAGMVATLTLSSDNESVVTLDAKDAPRTTKAPVKHHSSVWVTL